MKWTGERFVPGRPNLLHLYQEHMTRYIFAKQLTGGKNVVDLGCGAGYGSFFLAKNGAKSVVGFDSSQDAIQYCRNHYRAGNLRFEVGDVTKLRTNTRFDVAVAFELIEHLARYKDFLMEVKRHLTTRGLLVISTPNKNTYDVKNKFHLKEFYPSEFCTLLKKYFRNVRFYHQTYPPTLAILQGEASDSSSKRGRITPIFLNVDYQLPQLTHKSLYLVAVCSQSRIPRHKSQLFLFNEDTQLMKSYFEWKSWIPELVRERDKARNDLKLLRKDLNEKRSWAQKLDLDLKAIRSHFASLQAEFDERTQWALKLEKELTETRSHFASLQAEFDGRTQWALSLQDEVSSKTEAILKLQSELATARQEHK